ncbi:MAG: hypothetical protein LBT24_06980 [Tannerella sp.]|jgi:hypothetical protein|nr:hypothetical protein [Tannerella sp.]
MKNELIPKGWSFCENPESLKDLLPRRLPPYKGMLFIIASHGFCSANASRVPSQLCGVEKHLRQKYGDTAIDWVLYSEPHTNYLDNKTLVANNLTEFGVKDNFFYTDSIQDVIKKLPALSFIDNSEELEKSGELFCENMKKMLGWDRFDHLTEHSRLVNLAISVLCNDYAFHREDSVEEAMEECLKGEGNVYPCFSFQQDVFEDFQPLIRSFPWFKPIAIELSKEILWIEKTPEELKAQSEVFEHGGPFYFTQNIDSDGAAMIAAARGKGDVL